MLTGLEESIRRIEVFSFVELIEEVLRENSESILDDIREQLEHGIDGNGNPVTLYGNTEYSKFTVQQKKAFGSGIGGITDVITNYMTGEFYDSLFFTIKKGDEFIIDSNSSLIDLIELRSGDAIIKLSTESMSVLYDNTIKPLILNKMTSLFYAD